MATCGAGVSPAFLRRRDACVSAQAGRLDFCAGGTPAPQAAGLFTSQFVTDVQIYVRLDAIATRSVSQRDHWAAILVRDGRSGLVPSLTLRVYDDSGRARTDEQRPWKRLTLSRRRVGGVQSRVRQTRPTQKTSWNRQWSLIETHRRRGACGKCAGKRRSRRTADPETAPSWTPSHQFAALRSGQGGNLRRSQVDRAAICVGPKAPSRRLPAPDAASTVTLAKGASGP